MHTLRKKEINNRLTRQNRTKSAKSNEADTNKVLIAQGLLDEETEDLAITVVSAQAIHSHPNKFGFGFWVWVSYPHPIPIPKTQKIWV